MMPDDQEDRREAGQNARLPNPAASVRPIFPNAKSSASDRLGSFAEVGLGANADRRAGDEEITR